MDYEMEMGVIVGKPVSYGEAVSAKSARNNVFGFVLVNDWSGKLPTIDFETFLS